MKRNIFTVEWRHQGAVPSPLLPFYFLQYGEKKVVSSVPLCYTEHTNWN